MGLAVILGKKIKKSYFILLSTRLFVLLALPKVLSLGKEN